MQTSSSALLAAVFLGGLLAAPVQAAERPAGIEAAPNAAYAQYGRRGPVVVRGRGVRGGYYRRGPSGGAVAAGVIGGLAAGALIGGAIANSQAAAAPRPPGLVDPEVADYCARRYRTYDYGSGTYLSPSGERLVCTP